MTSGIAVLPLEGMPELRDGDDLGALLAESATRAGGLEHGDVVVVAQKAVSKVEGRVIRLDEVEPSTRAHRLAGDADPRQLEAILRESARIVRSRPPLVIAETRHGFVCASAGVDASNSGGAGTLVLLPEDPDGSARLLRDGLRARTGRELGVIVSDSFGRAWRQGTTDVALGVAGVPALLDLRGERDPADTFTFHPSVVPSQPDFSIKGGESNEKTFQIECNVDRPGLSCSSFGYPSESVTEKPTAGYELKSTQIAVADEIAGAAELVMGKTRGVPAAIVRGLRLAGDGRGQDLVMPADRDLFR